MNHILASDAGAHALALAMDEADPSSLAAATRLRAHVDSELAAVALQQAALRRKARKKFLDDADRLFFTSDGLEQASRPEVAAWRARRLADLGIAHVIDLGCGIASDARAFLAAGIAVTAVEKDAQTAQLARLNLGSEAEVICADALDWFAHHPAGDGAAVFVDPARRTARGRTWNLDDISPSWEFVTQIMASEVPVCAKMAPGLPTEVIAERMGASWVSCNGQLVETTLWAHPDLAGVREAVLLPAGKEIRVGENREIPAVPVDSPGRFIAEPDPAVIRSGLAALIAKHAWRIDAKIAYLSADAPLPAPFFTTYEVLEILDYSPKALKAWVRREQIGRLEIKKRGIDVDPAQLRRHLKLSGSGDGIVIISPTVDGARAFSVRRI